jgi:hypothetical protein
MGSYFRAKIDLATNGMMARSTARLPADVARVDGTVSDAVITVTMRDGTVWHWSGGRYATRKVDGCYAPLMPKPIAGRGNDRS